MKEGQIILAELAQANGIPKRRPALLLREMPGYGDYLVCGLSTQLRQYVSGFDEIMQPDATNGLRVTSLVRLGFLSVVPGSQILGSIGHIPETLHEDLLRRLADHLTNTAP